MAAGSRPVMATLPSHETGGPHLTCSRPRALHPD